MSQLSQPLTPAVQNASAAKPPIIGLDVAKKEVVVSMGQRILKVANTHRALKSWLEQLPAGACLAMEATGTYHQLVADLAYAAGFTVYVLNPQLIHVYRKEVGRRAKTDDCDARLIARYVEREIEDLHVYRPLSPAVRQLADLLVRRDAVVQARIALRSSFASLPVGALREADLTKASKAALQKLDSLLAKLDQALESLLRNAQVKPLGERLRSIVGVGPVTSAALVVAYSRGEFASADAFVASLGLDLIVRDSGQHKGQRRLSKRGNSQVRALLFTASMAAVRTKAWKEIYQRYLARGLKKTQALVALSRRIARAAWSIAKHGTMFDASRLSSNG